MSLHFYFLGATKLLVQSSLNFFEKFRKLKFVYSLKVLNRMYHQRIDGQHLKFRA